MWAIECIFYHPTIAAANTQKASWVGKPGYLGGYTRVGVPNSPIIADVAVGYWSVVGDPPNSTELPSWCRLVLANQPSLNYILGLTEI